MLNHFNHFHGFNYFIVKYNNLNLRRKILLSYFIFDFLLVGILAVTIYNFTAKTILQQNTFSLEQGFRQANDYLTYKLNSIRAASDLVIYNVYLNDVLAQEPALYSQQSQTADSRMIQQLLTNLQEHDEIRQARLYVPDELIYAGNSVNISPLSQAREAPWWDLLMAKKGLKLFIGGEYLEDGTYNRQERLALIRSMYRKDDYGILSFVLRLDISLKAVEAILNTANYTDDSITFLRDSSGRVVASSQVSGDSDPVSLIPPDLNRQLLEGQESDRQTAAAAQAVSLTLNGGKYMVLHAPLRDTGWTMVTLVPLSSFMLDITALMKTIAAVSVVALLLAYPLSKPIADTIIRRIEALGHYMKQNEEGVLPEAVSTSYTDEIGNLYENYNFMLERIQSLLHENYQIGRELKSAEYKALQSQINPHFLYNTLDLISWMSYQNQPEQINDIVYALAGFYKLSLNHGKDIVPIHDELNHVSYYIKIQNYRFSGSISFHLDVPPVLLQYSIPKITLQPIVENALFHGIMETETQRGEITVSGELRGDTLRLTVADDGCGMSADSLEALVNFGADRPQGGPRTESGREDSGSHYGLKNIHRRIQLLYGKPYGISFDSSPGQGTKVHVRLPLMHTDEL